jgi:type II secretory pathway pseudopilin PulG
VTTIMPRLAAALAVRSAAAVLAGRPLIGRNSGQRLARHELAEMTFWQRIVNWLARLPANAGTVVPGGWFGLISLAILAVVAVTVVLYWARPTRTRRARNESVLGRESMTARDYRRSAERWAAAGEYAGAIVDGVRAIAAELDERGILPPRPGRTAGELAAEAGGELPDLAADLRAVTRLFEDIRYGDKDGNLVGYQLVSRVDHEVRAARPASALPLPTQLTGFGVPR